MPKNARATKPTTIKKIIAGECVFVHSNYFVEGIEATKDKVKLRIGLAHYDGSYDTFVGSITATVVDTEVQIDETQVGTKSLPVIKNARRIILDTLAYLNKTTTPTAVATDTDDEAEDVRVDEPTEQGKKVIVIPMTKVSGLVGKTINGFYVNEVSLYYHDGKWSMWLWDNNDDVEVDNVFGCDYEIVEE